MRIFNTPTGYGAVPIALHWLIAGAFFLMLAIGLYMAQLPLGDPAKFPLFQFHKALGLTILIAVAFRLGWRFFDPPPELPESAGVLVRLSARIVHATLYFVLLAMPLSGWALVSASPYNIPTSYFGLFEWPHIGWVSSSPAKTSLQGWSEDIHLALAVIAGLTVCLHIGAAIWHHFIVRDDVLRRMLPGSRRT